MASSANRKPTADAHHDHFLSRRGEKNGQDKGRDVDRPRQGRRQGGLEDHPGRHHPQREDGNQDHAQGGNPAYGRRLEHVKRIGPAHLVALLAEAAHLIQAHGRQRSHDGESPTQREQERQEIGAEGDTGQHHPDNGVGGAEEDHIAAIRPRNRKNPGAGTARHRRWRCAGPPARANGPSRAYGRSERPTASAAWAAETSCAPLHSMGFLMVAMMLLSRACRGTMAWRPRFPGRPSVTANPWTCTSGKTIDLRQDVAEAEGTFSTLARTAAITGPGWPRPDRVHGQGHHMAAQGLADGRRDAGIVGIGRLAGQRYGVIDHGRHAQPLSAWTGTFPITTCSVY
jgi:hypothetical protein